MKLRIIYEILLFLFLIEKEYSNSEIPSKCGGKSKYIPKKIKEIPSKEKSSLLQRKLEDDGYQDFNIVLEYKNIETEIELYNLTKYKTLIIKAMEEALIDMKSLLKTKEVGCYIFDEDFVEENEFYYWDKEKFGITDKKKVLILAISVYIY